jgi:membrane protein required for colicin V production
MDALLTYLNDPTTPFGPADLVFGLYLAYGAIRGLFRGLPAELAGLLGTGVTVFTAWKFYNPVSQFIRSHTRLESPAGSSLLAYLLLILTLFIAWKGITFLLRKTLDWTCPAQLRRIGGLLLGSAKSLLVISALLTAVLLSGHEVLTTHLITQSALGRATQQVVPEVLHHNLPGLFPAPPGTPSEPAETEDGSGDA